MGSALNSIYSNLAAWSFTVGSQSVNALYGSTLKGSLGSADLPVRLLLPVNDSLEGTNVQAIVITGAHGTATWQIDDLLLLQPVVQGRGIEQVAGTLTTYLADYVDRLTTGYLLVGGKATVLNARPTSGIYEWPAGSGKAYYGARMTLTIQEVW